MAPLDAGQTSGTDNGPLLSGAGLPSDPPLSKKRTWKRAENPPQTASVDDLRSRDFASSLLQVNLFFSFFLSSLPRQQPAPPRAIVREATSKFFANGPLMAGYACVVFSNEPVGVVSSLITRITSTGKPSVRTRDDSFSFDHRSSIFFAILYTRAGPLQTSTSSLTKRASNGRKNRDCLVISSGLLAYEFVVTRVTRRIEVGIRYTRSLNFRLGTIMKRGFTFGGWCSLRSECWGRILLNADTYGVGGIKR